MVAAFDSGTITSNAGTLLLGETDRAIRLTERFAGCFTDARVPELVEHEVGTMVRSLSPRLPRPPDLQALVPTTSVFRQPRPDYRFAL